MIRKISFPLRYKFVAVLLTVLLSSLTFYIAFAVDLYKKDKSATVSESVLLKSFTLKTAFEGRIYSALQTFKNIKELLGDKHSSAIKQIFSLNEKVISISSYSIETQKNVVKLFNSEFFQDNDITAEEIFVNDSQIEKLEKLKDDFYYTINKIGQNEVLKISLLDHKRKESFVIRVLITDLVQMLKEGGFYQNNIILSNQYILDNINNNFKVDLKNSFDLVNSIQYGDDDYIVGYSFNKDLGLVSISSIPQKTAFKAANYLINKSIYFGLLVFSIGVIAGIFYSKKITNHLKKLTSAAIKIGEGDFTQKVKIKSRDEIGSLSDSFNYMLAEILKYIEEMKEKVRLENEVAVAKLVQENFFPAPDEYQQHGAIASYFAPASECGGDWFGSFSYNEYIVMVICDATGHGVPAALMTATAYCAVNNYELNLKSTNNSIPDSVELANLLNHSIATVGSNILMTAFIGIYNSETKELDYVNASHNPPLKFPKISGITKDRITPILGEISPRLGESAKSKYIKNKLEVFDSEVILLYTDGIVEVENSEGKQFGQRRLLKSIMENSLESTSTLRSKILEAVFEFQGSEDATLDDMSLMLFEPHPFEYSYILNEDHFISEKSNLIEFETVLKKNNLINFNLLQKSKSSTNSLSLIKSSAVSEGLESLLEKFDDSDYFDECKTIIKKISEELVTNAFYHRTGVERIERTEIVELKIEDAVKVELLQTDLAISVTVTSKNAYLSREQFNKAISRAFLEKTPNHETSGAGLGLALVLKNCNVLIVDTRVKNQTAITIIIEKNKRYVKFLERGLSFHWMEK